MTEQVDEPCGNEDCDACYPLPKFKITTERVQRLFHEREIKAANADEALRIYNEGTAWPSDYDTRGGEVLEHHDPVVAEIPPLEEPLRTELINSTCWNRNGINKRVADMKRDTE